MWKLYKFKVLNWWSNYCEKLNELVTFKFPNCKQDEPKNICPICKKNFGCQCGN